MRIVGLLSWYEESPAWLAECVASAARLCDHLIAVDGPYAAFPGALKKPYSGTEQADTILRTAAGAGMGCTIHSSRQPWWGERWGGEVQKRDFMFKLGQAFTTESDWFLRIDADEVLTDIPSDARTRLVATDLNVAEVMIWEREAGGHVAELVDTVNDYQSTFRCLFRAIPGIRIEQTHYTVTAPVDGRRVVLNGLHQEPAEELWDIRLEHRTHQRTASRQRLKREYSVQINDFEKVEDGPCEASDE
ncbi:hypothetical protein [Mycobacterium phage WXIN]|nr:hypothetical protein [Mycobacterium phage WXIN]